MQQLSSAGTQLVQTLSQRHGFSIDAVTHMLIAVSNGNGSMAQFSHHEFGGSGQWMAGGMLMIGDMFNGRLKGRVQNLCSDIALELSNHQTGAFMGSFQSQSQNGSSNQNQYAGGTAPQNSLFVPDPQANWWPQELGSPSASGSQNHCKYAYFPNACRLAVATGNSVWVYDTLNHNIGGFSQQQSGDGSITFSSQFGVVPLSSLPVVIKDGQKVEPQSQNPVLSPAPAWNDQSSNAVGGMSDGGNAGGDVLATLERLGDMMEKGYITQDEYATKKADLLSRL